MAEGCLIGLFLPEKCVNYCLMALVNIIAPDKNGNSHNIFLIFPRMHNFMLWINP